MASTRAAISEDGVGRILFACYLMAPNVANRPVLRHPISGRNGTQRRLSQPDASRSSCRVSNRSSTSHVIPRSDDADAPASRSSLRGLHKAEWPGMTIQYNSAEDRKFDHV